MALELEINNLYGNAELLDFPFDGEQMLVREPLVFPAQISQLYYRIKKDDRLDLIAYRFYSPRVEDAAKFWWVIADANNIFDPMDLTEYLGHEITVPDISTVLLLI